MHNLTAYLRVFLIFARNSLVRDMTFRANFIIDTISVRYDSDRLTRDEIKKKVDQSNRVSKGR